MSESKVTTRVVLHWVPVPDERGRVRLEMRWSDPAAALVDASTGVIGRSAAASHAA